MNARATSGDYRGDSSAVYILRAALRRDRLAARAALSDKDRQTASARIENHLTALLEQWRPGVLAYCWPIRGEFDCRRLMRDLLSKHWRLCQPVAVEEDRPLVFRAWTPTTIMARDQHGIPVPAEGQSLLPDIVLVPLVAFDNQGYRLGYGGGYFDRTLAALVPRPFAVGVGFELGQTDTIHPQPHDIPMNVIVTENGLRRAEAPVDFPGQEGDHGECREFPNE